MSTKQSWKAFTTIVIVFLGGMGLVLASFALSGFPFARDPMPQLVWVELAFLLVLLGIPLFR